MGQEAQRDVGTLFGCIAESVIRFHRICSWQRRGWGTGSWRSYGFTHNLLLKGLDHPERWVVPDALGKGHSLIKGGIWSIPKGGGLRVFYWNTLQKPLWCDGGNRMGGLQHWRYCADKVDLAIALSLCLSLSFAIDTVFSLLFRAARCAAM
jgi:hypothetical protein